jgi:hypothetical protein
VQLIGLNSVPVVGIFVAGWDNGTAIALYWCETVIAVLLAGWTIRSHRLLRNLRGHHTQQRRSDDAGRTYKTTPTTYAKAFMTTACAFLAAEGVVVGLFAADIDFAALAHGVEASAVCLLAGAVLDRVGMNARPFAWVRGLAQGTLWRVFLIFFAVFFGLFLAWFDLPRGAFVVFAALKLYTDIATLVFPQYAAIDEEQRKQFAEDEEPYRGQPSRSSKVGSTIVHGGRRRGRL